MIPVIAARPDGLGTRLLTILFARQFAERFGVDLSVSWPSLNDENYADSESLLKADKVGEIFENEQVFKSRSDVSFVSPQAWSGKRALFLHGLIDQMQGKTLAEIRGLVENYDVLIYDLPFQVATAEDDQQLCQEDIKRSWLDYNFAADVKGAFDTLSAKAKLDQSVAAHVRRGDVVNMVVTNDLQYFQTIGVTQVFQRYIPFKTVVDLVTTNFTDAPALVVCSEDQGIAERFQKALPRTTIITSQGIFPPGGNKAALLDLLLLAGAQDLITPFKSYFSDCAAAVGRCRVHNAGLDIPNLIPEIISIIDERGGEDEAARRAVIYTIGYKNLWYKPEDPYRAVLLQQAQAADPDLTARLLA